LESSRDGTPRAGCNSRSAPQRPFATSIASLGRGIPRPVSRVLSNREDFGRSFLSECDRPHPLAAYPRRVHRRGLLLAAYSALLQLGFAVPSVSPRTRWALTPPFHPYPRFREGGLFSVALSVTELTVPRRYLAACPWSPDFPRNRDPASASRPSGRGNSPDVR
jgi:hypothetical protein